MTYSGVTQEQTELIDLLFADKDNMMMAMRMNQGDRYEESYLVDGYSYNTSRKYKDTTLAVIRNIALQIQNAPKSINNVVTILERLLANTVIKSTTENYQTILELDFDALAKKTDNEDYKTIFNYLADIRHPTAHNNREFISQDEAQVFEAITKEAERLRSQAESQNE